MADSILVAIIMFIAKWWFIVIPSSFLLFFFIIFIIAFLHNRGKVACLYFNTDKTCKITFEKIEPTGTVTIDDKKFMVARSRPSIFEKKIRFFPLYILKHDCTEPINIVMTAEEQLKEKSDEEKMLPSTLNDFMNMTTLKALLSITTESKKGLIMFIIVGFIIGFLLSFVLISMDIIQLSGG